MKTIYFDNNATTAIAPEVFKAMEPYFMLQYGNPSSLHKFGIEAERAVKQSRRAIARLLGVDEQEIVFTSGATESINLAIQGTAWARKRLGNHIITTEVEHEAVLNTVKALEEKGFEVTYVTPDQYGRVKVEDVLSAVREDTILASIIHVNNELGTINPIHDIAKQLNPQILFFSDGAQAFGKIRTSLEHIDLYSISGHKIHGPKGVGALYIRQGVNIHPLVHGGKQEFGLRSGTENVPGIVGFAKAAELGFAEDREHVRHLKKRFLEGMQGIDECTLNSPKDAIESTINVAFPGIPAEILLHALEEKGIFVSTGSACSSKNKRVSHVLKGLAQEIAESSIRISFSRYNTLEEIVHTVFILKSLVVELRETIKT